ncbi:MAG: hypothetical protein RL120_08495, partial [Gammaproteobacteria bacterium]
MSSNTAAEQGDFTFFSNRGARVFAQALSPLGGREWTDGDGGVDLLYFDAYAGNQAPVTGARFSLIDRQRTMPLDNKAQMTAALLRAGRNYPRVYFQPEQVPSEPGSLWFIKNSTSTAGKGTVVVSYEQLAQQFMDNCIIEELVQDVSLINERKFTLRLYLLVVAGKLYFYPDAIIFLHAVPYAPNSCDPMVQFVHDGYMDPDSPVTAMTSRDYADYPELQHGLEKLALHTFSVFADLLKYEAPTRYCLFGVDALARTDRSSVVVEINDRPNIVHTSHVNKQVNVPMIRAMYCVFDPPRGALLSPGATRFRLLG